ncbi:MAG: glycerol-3-phosphate 1-O-acyltransferase PlsY [Verrucomicrobiota bacterium]
MSPAFFAITLFSSFAIPVVAYLIGSIPFGLLAGKLKGVDVREHGSGNIGATNVLRTCGKPVGIAVLILDLLKGLAPVLLARTLAPDNGLLTVLAAVFAILGHNYPCWLGFKGGKGIATSAGALIGFLPIAFLIALVAWVVAFFTTRYVAIASIAAAVSLPISVVTMKLLGHPVPMAYIVFAVLVGGLAVWRHRSNIERLRAGTEHRFESRKKDKTNTR